MRAGGLFLARIAGVEVRADWSLLLIIALVAFNLGAGAFPMWHPTWSPLLTWSLAIAAALLLVASIAAHELSHALMGRRHGIPIRRITLFVFGGMAHMDRAPARPRDELATALIGPIVSILIGIAATGAGLLLANRTMPESGSIDEMAASIGPIATLLLWLGPINTLLGVFNLVPGFPLDGGRVLRAILWAVTGDLRRATRWAARTGQAIALVMVATGFAMAMGAVVPVLGGGPLQGLWLALIGWFLYKAARASVYELELRERLGHAHVLDVMRSDVETVAPELSVAGFARGHVVSSDQLEFPVVRDRELIGVVGVSDLRALPRDRWDQTTVAAIMTPAARLDVVRADDELVDALRALSAHEQVPVVDGGRLVGVARRRDLVSWMALHGAA
jgi:Zn-dependent protease/CBS domain-containing protein